QGGPRDRRHPGHRADRSCDGGRSREGDGGRLRRLRHETDRAAVADREDRPAHRPLTDTDTKMGESVGERTRAARIAQRLTGPAQALLGVQELVVDQVREEGPDGALPDLERVLSAARSLDRLVADLVAGEAASGGADVEARLRHDLRTPINAILGYSE